MDNTFKITKTILAADILMTYPNNYIPFHMCINASDYLMDTIIIKQKQPVGYGSCKLTEIQQKYQSMGTELHSIAMVLEEFCSKI